MRRGGPERHRTVSRVAQQARLRGIAICLACWGHLFFSLTSVLEMNKKWGATRGLVVPLCIPTLASDSMDPILSLRL